MPTWLSSRDTAKTPESTGRLLFRALGGEEAQDLAEYAMLAALIVVVVIVALVAMGGALAGLWGNITTRFAALP